MKSLSLSLPAPFPARESVGAVVSMVFKRRKGAYMIDYNYEPATGRLDVSVGGTGGGKLLVELESLLVSPR